MDIAAARSSARDARYPRCKVNYCSPGHRPARLANLIVTDCLSTRVTKFSLAVNVGPFRHDLKANTIDTSRTAWQPRSYVGTRSRCR